MGDKKDRRRRDAVSSASLPPPPPHSPPQHNAVVGDLQYIDASGEGFDIGPSHGWSAGRLKLERMCTIIHLPYCASAFACTELIYLRIRRLFRAC